MDNYNVTMCIAHLRNEFDEFKWNKIYDFVEFLLGISTLKKEITQNIVKNMNIVLEREFSGYRIIGKQITPITNSTEIEEISKALNTPLQEINTHFKQALVFLSDRKNPDPRNSIKESISAVEILCKKIIGDPNATLGSALTKLKETKKMTLHPSMEEAIKQLYRYTNEASGIRHSLVGEKITANFDDAKFMIVYCSAFVNYMIAKSNDAEINLS